MKKQTQTKPASQQPEPSDGLPVSPTQQVADPLSLRYLIVGPPGFGKTELCTSFPDALLLACEEGHKFVAGYKIVIDSWDESDERTDSDGNLHLSFLEAVARLTATDRFKFVIIDTVDALIKVCIERHLDTVSSRSKGITDAEHISDLGDFGKGYDLAMNNPIRQAFNAILKTGRGMAFITHTEMKTYDHKGNVKTVKKETTLPNGIIKQLYPQCDLILHGEFGEVREGQTHRDRIIRTEGTEEILAKNRGGVLPPAYIVPLDIPSRWEQLKSFFDPENGPANIKIALDEFEEFYQR